MMPNIKYFILVLSTIGEEQLVGNDRRNPSYRHFFYTKKGMFDTQELMTKINEIEELQNRMKIFFIQAHSTRIHKEQEYLVAVDHIYKTKAKTYEHDEDIEKIETSFQVAIPPCDDCVVVFPCMPGPPACHTIAAERDGSWMLSALYRTLDKYEVGSTVHILDILTGVNRDMNQYVLSRRVIPDLIEKVEQKLCEKNIYEENLEELEQINKRLNELDTKFGHPTKGIQHISELTLRTEKVVGSVELKSHLCFNHNLGFADDYMTLHKTRNVIE